MKEPDYYGSKALLIAAAITLGLVVFDRTSFEVVDPGGFLRSATYKIREGWEIKGPLLGLACALLYPVFAAVAVSIVLAVRNWASLDGTTSPLNRGDKLILGAAWPFSLVAGVIVYTYLGLINRLFR